MYGGSPPQVWGKRWRAIHQAHVWRFTPTGVGKTAAASAPVSSRQVHPHRCGENSVEERAGYTDIGSPPQVWGKRNLADQFDNLQGFTPTGVGKTVAAAASALAITVHPHRCGENVVPSSVYIAYPGSPPQVWGKLGRPGGERKRFRFTPTGVGKTMSICVTLQTVTVHPHRCGENHHRSRASGHQLWFTPTGVGKTFPRDICRIVNTVHPHRCGENSFARYGHLDRRGSPPQVWGKLAELLPTRSASRFTPTGVGKTDGFHSIPPR